MSQWYELIIGDRASTILAGALGGVVRWITLKEKPREGIASVIVGSICAVYLGPLVQPALTPLLGSFVVEETARSGFGGFVLGLGGITLSGFVIDFLKGWARKVPAPPVAPVVVPAQPTPPVEPKGETK